MSEWGPWIEHDGKACPCVGMVVHVIFGDLEERVAIAGSEGGDSWEWSKKKFHANRVIRYRIRKPRGMTILESLLDDLPETENAWPRPARA